MSTLDETKSETEFNRSSDSKIDFEFVSGTDIREPYEDRGGLYRPYEATALIYDERHQNKVWDMLHVLIIRELGGKVAPKTLEYISNSIQHRMHARDGANSSSYTVRLNQSYGELDESCMRAIKGLGTFKDNDNARRFFGMPSVEYGNLTIIGNKRSEFLEDMYQETKELLGVEELGSELYGLEVIGFDRVPANSNHLGAVRVKAKVHLGYLDDETEVKQRTIAVIDLSPGSGFDQDIVQEIIAAHKLYMADKNAGKFDVLREVPSFRKALSEIFGRKLESQLVLARNVTIYGHNERVAMEIQKLKSEAHIAKYAMGNTRPESDFE